MWVCGTIQFHFEKNQPNFIFIFFQYDAQSLGGHGGGGEYEVQKGFGWSNGAVMDLMDKYGDRLTTGSAKYD